MKELILELDRVSEKLKEASSSLRGTTTVDEKSLKLFDITLLELIETKNTLDFVAKKRPREWEYILGLLKIINFRG